MGRMYAVRLEKDEQESKRWPEHKHEWVQKQRKAVGTAVTASSSARGAAANPSRMNSILPTWNAGVSQHHFFRGLSGDIFDGVCPF